MKTLIIYDSLYGNTEQIARAIGEAISGEVKLVRVAEANPSDLESIDLFIVGSPTQGARPTKAVQELINKIDSNALNNVDVASFDTRFSSKAGGIGTRMIAGLAGSFGYAAGRISDSLKDKGGHLIKPPEGFIVKGAKGPLKEGEIERAAIWARSIITGDK